MKSIVLLLFTACVFAAFFSTTLAQTNAPPDAVSNLPGFSGTLPTRNFAGYITVNSTNSARVFYWFTEAENATAETPIIIYSNALGCSSLMNSFLGQGPFWVNKTSSGGFQVVSNQRGWNRVAHMLFVDAPFGSGFSIVNGLNGIEGIPTTDMEAADQFIQFINGFFTLHPDLAQLPIYLGAQGLAAKFVTVAAYRALLQKNATSTQTFNSVFSQNYDIRGLVMESDETNPLIGFLTRVDQAFYLGLISHSQWLQLKPLQSQCIRDVQSGNYNFTSTACSLIDMSIKMASGGNSIYDARQFGQFPRFPKDVAWAEWLNIQDVQSALHMDTSVQYIPCNPNVEIAMSEDLLRPVHYLIPRLLAGGMKIFMLHGNFDASGSGSVEFENVLTVLANYSSYPRNLIALGEAIVGYVQEIPQGLTFATVADASYWVTHDHPVTSVTLLEWFLRNQTFAENGTNAIIPRIQLSNGLEIVFQPFGNTSAVNSSDPEYHTMIQPIDSSLINATQPSWLQVPVDISNYMCSILFNNCSGVGQCNNGQCVCQDGHIGPLCSYREDNLTTAATLNANQQPSNDWYFLRIPAGNLASNTSRVIISFTQVSQVVMLNNEDPFNTGDVTIHDVGSTIAGGAIPDRLCIYAKLNQAPTFNLFDSVQCYAYEDLSKALVFNIPNLSASANGSGDWHIGIYNGLRNVALSYGIALSS